VNQRDYEFIEARLLAPSMGAAEACERLKAVGQRDLAEQVLRAEIAMQDACRAVRRELQRRRVQTAGDIERSAQREARLQARAGEQRQREAGWDW
jgi:hypothetical protein